jgi:hypothetical protein
MSTLDSFFSRGEIVQAGAVGLMQDIAEPRMRPSRPPFLL